MNYTGTHNPLLDIGYLTCTISIVCIAHGNEGVDYFIPCSKKKVWNMSLSIPTLSDQSNQLQMTYCGTTSDAVSRIKVVACHETEVAC